MVKYICSYYCYKLLNDKGFIDKEGENCLFININGNKYTNEDIKDEDLFLKTIAKIDADEINEYKKKYYRNKYYQVNINNVMCYDIDSLSLNEEEMKGAYDLILFVNSCAENEGDLYWINLYKHFQNINEDEDDIDDEDNFEIKGFVHNIEDEDDEGDEEELTLKEIKNKLLEEDIINSKIIPKGDHVYTFTSGDGVLYYYVYVKSSLSVDYFIGLNSAVKCISGCNLKKIF